MAASSVSSNQGLVRSLWPQKSIYEELFEESPALGMVPKDTTFDEKYRYITVGIGAPQGVGADFTVVKEGKTASTSREFTIAAQTYYGLFSVEGRIMRMAKNSGKSVIVDPLKRESTNTLQQMKRDFSNFIHRDGAGVIGQISSTSTVASTVITLANAQDIRNFEIGMRLTTSTVATGAGTLKGGFVTVTNVGTEASPTVTVSGNWNAGIPLVAVSDYIYRRSVYGNIFYGFNAWCPTTVSATLFNNVDRTAHENRLAGYRETLTTFQPRAALLRLARRIATGGATPKQCFHSPKDYEDLQLELQAAGAMSNTKAPAASIGKYSFGIEYDAISLMGPRGEIKVFCDPDRPQADILMTDLSKWKLASTGELIQTIELGGPNGLMVEETADAAEGRFVSDSQLYTEAPWATGRGFLAT